MHCPMWRRGSVLPPGPSRVLLGHGPAHPVRPLRAPAEEGRCRAHTRQAEHSAPHPSWTWIYVAGGLSPSPPASPRPLLCHVRTSHSSACVCGARCVGVPLQYGMSVLGVLRADVIGLLAKPLEAKGLLHWNAAVTEVSHSLHGQERMGRLFGVYDTASSHALNEPPAKMLQAVYRPGGDIS